MRRSIRVSKEKREAGISEKLSDNFIIFEKKKNILVMSDGM